MWPRASTTWLTVANGHLSSEHPKLTILLDDPATSEAGRGPTLRIGSASRSDVGARRFRGNRSGLASSRPSRATNAYNKWDEGPSC